MDMRFAADRMLGKLAKWLRLLGYDTLYSRTLSDEEFLRLADKGRILLSRNTRIADRMPPDRLIIIESNDPRMQLKDLIRLLDMAPDSERFYSRCIVCNGLIQPIESRDVVGKVPDHIWNAHSRFSGCETCGRIYWSGSHLQHSLREIERILSS